MAKKQGRGARVPVEFVEHVGSKKLVRVIGEVWQRLKPPVREVIKQRLTGIYDGVKADVGGKDGSLWPVETVVRDGVELGSQQCYIWLDAAGMEGMSDTMVMAVICHELAHVFLGHSVYARATFVMAETEGLKVQAIRDVHEWDADLCVFLWGFAEELEERLRQTRQNLPPWWIKPENIHYYDEQGNEIERPAEGAQGPGTPPGLAGAGAKGTIRISVDRPTEKDWALTEYYVSTEQDFTPSAETLALSGKVCTYTHTCSAYIPHYVRVRHGDTSGNWSNYSVEGSATPSKIDPPSDIPDGTIPDAKIIEVEWAKIKNAVIQSADIVSLVASKITTGSLTAAIDITTMGTLSFADSGGVYLEGAASFLKCFGSFATASPNDISSGSILLDSSGPKIYVGGSTLGADLVAADDIFLGIGNAYCLNAGGTAYIYLTGTNIKIGGAGFDVTVMGDFDVDGVKDCVMPTTQGRIRLATVESPEVLFMDRVAGAKHEGIITGQLDPLFAEVVEPGDAWLIPAYPAQVVNGGFEAEIGEDLFWLVARRRGKAHIRFAEAPPSGERENLPGAPVAVELQSLSLGPNRLKVAACLCDANNVLLRGTVKVVVKDDVPRMLRDALSDVGALLRQYSEGLAGAQVIRLDITAKGLWHTWVQSMEGDRGQRKVHARILTKWADVSAEAMESVGELIRSSLQVVGYEEDWNGKEPSG